MFDVTNNFKVHLRIVAQRIKIALRPKLSDPAHETPRKKVSDPNGASLSVIH
jgi:hypothetical protein